MDDVFGRFGSGILVEMDVWGVSWMGWVSGAIAEDCFFGIRGRGCFFQIFCKMRNPAPTTPKPTKEGIMKGPFIDLILHGGS